MEAENADLDLSIVALDSQDNIAATSGSGIGSSSIPHSVEQASCSIFEDDDEDDM